jgi:hypothetical protein
MPTDEEYAGLVLDLQTKMDKRLEERGVKFSNLAPVMQGVITLLTIIAFVVPCVLGFVNFDKRIDIVESDASGYALRTDKAIDRLDISVDENEDSIHALELVDKGLTVQYQEILRRQGEMLSEIKNLTRVD